MDFAGLETVVANSAYVAARGSIDYQSAFAMRDKRMRARLKLSPVSQCQPAEGEMDLAFESICCQQPVGKRLFQHHLRSTEQFKMAAGLWQAMEDYKSRPEEAKHATMAQDIARQYYDSSSRDFCSFLSEEAIARVREGQGDSQADLFWESERQLLSYLEAQAFEDYKASRFFQRFLQFKELERQPVGEEWFSDFRVLGKGGFGEVCACQMRATGKLYANKKLNKKRLKKRKGHE
eukprot:g28365.t1